MVFKHTLQSFIHSFPIRRRRPKRRAARNALKNTRGAAEVLEPRAMLSVTANADENSMVHGEQAAGNVTTNDTITASNVSMTRTAVSLTVTSGTPTGTGTLTVQTDPGESGFGDYLYLPPAGIYTGSATFSYTLTDTDTNEQSTASVTIIITNDTPVIADPIEAQTGDTNDAVFTAEVGTTDPIEIPIAAILSHFTDPNSGDQLELVLDGALYGGIAFSSSNPEMLEYTPPVSGFVGGDPFDEVGFKAKDGGNLMSNRLRFFPRGSGTVDGYGIYLVDRPAVGFALSRHSAIMIVPTDQATWAADPRFARVTKAGLHYATLSAHPHDMTSNVGIAAGLTKLRSTVSWSADEWKTLKEIEVLSFVGMTENQMIQKLFDLDAAFDDDALKYKLSPDESDNSYNSNSYAHGLINAAGLTTGVAPGWHPGWDRPLPAAEFIPD